MPAPAQTVVGEAIDQLRSTVEELGVIREELLEQNQAFSADQRDAQAEEHWLRALLRHAPDPLLATDARGQVRACNDAAAELLRGRATNVEQKPLAVFVAEGARAGFRTRLARAMLRAVPAAIAALDLNGTVLSWNPAAGALLGWPEEDVVGKPFPGLSETDLALLHAAPRPPHEREPWTREEALAALAAAAGRTAEVSTLLRTWLAWGLHLGYLRPGDRLPSIREVAACCGVDHRAVSGAYRAIAADGLLEVRNRHGAFVAAPPPGGVAGLCETGSWLAGVLADAARLRVRVPLLAETVQRWTASTPVRCACVESTEDDLAALAGELAQQWGLETVRVPLAPAGEGEGRSGRASLADRLRDCDLVATSPFHEAEVRAAAAASGTPVVVATLHPDVLDAAEQRLREGELTVVAVDPAFGERLAALRGAGPGRVRVVRADDAKAVAALDPAQPVLLTRAAHERLRGLRARLLVPPTRLLAPVRPRDVAEVLIDRNMGAGRSA